MMKTICESGATKADWRLTEAGEQTGRILTGGMNVSTMPRQTIEQTIAEAGSRIPAGKVEAVHFYVAGIATPEIQNWLIPALERSLKCKEIEIQDDMMAAARAACGHAPGIAAILGTGSNSCFFDGSEITRKVKSGGFILGDEGSASNIGKLFISDYIKGLVPQEIAGPFEERYPGLDYAAIVDEVYHSKGSPSGWLGSFCPFILSHYGHPYVKRLVEGSLQAFIDRSLLQYDTDKYPVGIVGGFATAIKDILTPLLERSGIRVRAFIPSPIEELIRYHG